jgi:hypothetical protein
MEIEGLLPSYQEPATCRFPETDESSTYNLTLFV